MRNLIFPTAAEANAAEIAGPPEAAESAEIPAIARRPPPASARQASARRAGLAAAYLGLFCLAVASQLLRLTPIPAWQTLYAEDYGIFLVQALEHPWHLFMPYAGYEQLVPRVFGQVAALLPLPRAAEVDALGSAVLDVACAFFVYHASEGFIRSRALRAVLVAAILLVGIAPIEVVANPTNSQWYLMCALFWAVLWRPRTRTGMAASALVAFLTTATNPVAIIWAPVLALRAAVLRRPREHAVTAGYLAGWVMQAVVIGATYGDKSQRVTQLASLGHTVPYYFHWVPLRALGWHLSWWLSQVAGWNGATVIIGLAVLAVLAWAATQGRQARAFIVLAVLLGFAETILSATITGYVTVSAPISNWEMASRYTLMPIMALDAAAIVGVDALARRHGGVRAAFADLARAIRTRARLPGLVTVAAVTALVVVLAGTWVPDYRYQTERVGYGLWSQQADKYLRECQHHPTIRFFAWQTPHNAASVSCANIVR